MPQFDTTTYSSQIFWLIISGVLLYSFVKWFFVPRLEGIFKSRLNHLESEKKTIQELEERLKAIEEKRTHDIEHAEQQAFYKLKDMQTQLDSNASAQLTALDQDLQKKVSAFEAEMSVHMQTIYQNFQDNKQTYVQTITDKLIKKSG
ncbi:MAG: hypothetical protein Q8K36_05985 [Alphaproteobacteria bacterium]|nr:hypothetical protein [Alphaproteobacteria bacterium]